ncbi:MAG TPA: redoxin domain-containing protein [Dehalococcoidia bacterium]|nr:redoxin domain-containing protein [Dehalococcoidia bacterium]
MDMRLHLAWITRKKLFVAPLVLLVLLLAVAACGSDSDTSQAQNAIEAERMEAEAAAMEDEKMEAEAMAMEEEKMAAEAMAMEDEKMEAEAMAMKEAEAMAIEEEKKEAEAMAMKAGASLKLGLSGVEPLANGYHYEGWAIIGSRSNGPTATNEESAIMQLNKNLALAAAVAVSVVLAAACGSSESAATTVPTATQAPPAGSSDAANESRVGAYGSGSAAYGVAAATQEPTATPPPLSATKSAVADVDRKVGGTVGDRAPEFGGIDAWINGGPLTMAGLRGSVVLIDFWTYTCINTYPFLKDMQAKYADKGLVVVGVHSPEFEFEKSYENVVAATIKDDLVWTMAEYNDFITWRRYDNRYWPSEFLIDKDGVVRYTHIGEGAYAETEIAIQELLAEIGS